MNMIYCLIYLDDIVIFSQMVEEHHCLCIIFDWFQEHNLKRKPLKCNFFREEITYFAHWVSKDGVHPSNLNLKAIKECVLPQMYTKVHAFLVWFATTEGSSRGSHALHSHLMNTWLGKGPAGSWSGCHFQKMSWRLLKHWNRHVWQLLFWLLLTTLNHSYKNVEFSSCLELCIFKFSLEQDTYFIRETSFHQFSNMASSGLKKMLSQ